MQPVPADSEISRLHETAGREVRVGPLLAEELRAARLTEGLVDPTVGSAVRALGYDCDFALVAHDRDTGALGGADDRDTATASPEDDPADVTERHRNWPRGRPWPACWLRRAAKPRRCSPAATAGRGPRAVYALPRRACGLEYTAKVLAFLAAESARQCGPCRFGLPSIAADFAELVRGGPSTPRLAGSALQVFDADVRAHQAGAGSRRVSHEGDGEPDRVSRARVVCGPAAGAGAARRVGLSGGGFGPGTAGPGDGGAPACPALALRPRKG